MIRLAFVRRSLQTDVEVALTRLAEILDEQGRRRDWLASQTGMSAPLVTLICQGKRNPSPEFRRKAADALGVPEHELFPEVATTAA